MLILTKAPIANLFIIQSPLKVKVETLCADATLHAYRTAILHPSADDLSILSGARTETSKPLAALWEYDGRGARPACDAAHRK
jgi:hypothetical protein